MSIWRLYSIRISDLNPFISYNKISVIPPYAFSDLKNLESLALNNNLIQEITNETFYGLLSLTELRLGQNNISSISKDAFSWNDDLRTVDLRNNRIHYLHHEWFAKKSFISRPGVKSIFLA